MKKILLTLAAVALATSAFAQTTLNGTLSFHNRGLLDNGDNGEPILNGGAAHTAPITLTAAAKTASGAPTLFADNLFSAGVFWKNASGQYVLANAAGDGVTPSTASGLQTLWRTAAGQEGTFSNPVLVEIPGKSAGSTVTFQVRAWLTSQGSYDNATVRGSSADITIAGLGGNPPGGGAPATAPNFSHVGFTGFQITPEPSTYALGIAGLGALAMMRRRK